MSKIFYGSQIPPPGRFYYLLIKKIAPPKKKFKKKKKKIIANFLINIGNKTLFSIGNGAEKGGIFQNLK